MQNEGNKEEEIIKKTEDAVKILITKDAEKNLVEAISRVNDGFDGGKITRQAVASWLIEKAATDLSEADIKAIRAQNFNALNALAALYKRAQDTGQIPSELRQILLSQMGIDTGPRKGNKNKLTLNYINGVAGSAKPKDPIRKE